MDLYELQFGKIIILQDDIAEVIINDGIEMDLAMVETYHDFLIDHLVSPFSLLINKINAYTYNFEAQKKIATLPEIKAMAIVAYNRMTEHSTQALINFPRDNRWNVQIFNQRDKALNWLHSQPAASQPANQP